MFDEIRLCRVYYYESHFMSVVKFVKLINVDVTENLQSIGLSLVSIVCDRGSTSRKL